MKRKKKKIRTRILHIASIQSDRDLVQDAFGDLIDTIDLAEASTKKEIKSALSQSKFDIILSNVNETKYRSANVLDYVKGIDANLPVICLLGNSFEIEEVLKKGADEFIIKSPGYSLEINYRIQNVLDKKFYNSELIRVQQGVRETERKFDTLITNFPGLAYRCKNDHDWTMEYVSDGCLTLTGYAAEDFISKRVLFNDLIHPDDRSVVWEKVQDQVKQKKFFQLEYRIFDKSNLMRQVWEQGGGVYDENDQLIALEGFVIDTSEQKQAITNYKEQQQFFRQVIDMNPNFIFAKDRQGYFTLANQAVATAYGTSVDGLIGKRDNDFNPNSDEVEQFLADDLDVINSKIYKYIPEEKITDATGQIRWLQTLKQPLAGPDGQVDQVLGVATDITKIKQQCLIYEGYVDVLAQLATGISLTTFLTKLAVTMEELNPEMICSILLLDTEKKILRHGAAPSLPDFYNNAIDGTEIGPGVGSCGQAAYSGKHASAENIMEHPNWSAFRKLAKKVGIAACFSEPIISMSTGGVLGTFAVYFRYPHQPSQNQIDAIKYNARLAGIGIEQKNIELTLKKDKSLLTNRVLKKTTELKTANKELIKAAQLKDEFLALMSHELRTPLNGILGLAELMVKEIQGKLTPKQKRSISLIEENGRHLLEIINDILDIAKIDAGKLELNISQIEINAVCQTCSQFVGPLVNKKKLKFILNIEKGIDSLIADQRRLKQILINLLANAIKFTPQNGSVGLDVMCDFTTKSIHFSVWDTGIGIAESDYQHLFKPFSQIEGTSTRKFEGPGLGLSLVHKLTKIQGGDIKVESTLNSGSRFTLVLPQKNIFGLTESGAFSRKRPKTTAEINNFPQADFDDRRAKILVADDSDETTVISEYLSFEGYEVILSKNGEEAVNYALNHHPDLILMDIHMPKLNGLEAIKKIRRQKHFANIPIITFTAAVMPDDEKRCLDSGADLYLSKPIPLKKLLTAIETLLPDR